jgi:stringent starvation protein B
MAEISTKPYFLRAIYEWCADSGFTPYLSVKVDGSTRVPVEYVKNGEIVLNVSANATRNLTISNDLIQFSARFNGVSREISVPVARVAGIFARENGHGAFFQVEEGGAVRPTSAPRVAAIDALDGAGDAKEAPASKPPSPTRPRLTVVK